MSHQASKGVGAVAAPELMYGRIVYRCCGTFLLYPLFRFRIMPLTCGAKGTRTPGLLHAIQTQTVARCGLTSPCVLFTCSDCGFMSPASLDVMLARK